MTSPRTAKNFRYERHRDGTVTLADVDRLDVCRFHEAMEGVASYLSAVAEATGVYLDFVDDDMYDYYGES